VARSAHLRLVAKRMEPDEDWSVLMARAQKGDARAYAALLVSVTPYARALARRALADPRDAEEAVQDILLTLHRIRQTYDPDRPFAPWLATIAQRRIVDRVRVNAQHARRKLSLARELLIEPEIAKEMPHSDDYEALRAAISALPDGQRQAVELLKLRELSLKEAAIVSGLSVAALKVAAHRAVKSLRRRLEQPKSGS
jgi:RNA polymerase sigma-70 factor (ECF subfamily)